MLPFSSILWSSVGKKILTGLTGILLTLFVIGHMAGNMSLFIGSVAFNSYTKKLESLGLLLYVIEIGLVSVFVIHAIIGISIYLKKREARPEPYMKSGDASGNTQKTVSSVTMIWTGLIMLVFTVLHLITFKYGPHYLTVIDGVAVRDLYRLVIEVFQRPSYTFGYVIVMILLGFHLRHGFWSAFQSLGLTNPRMKAIVYGLGIFLSFLLAIGFLSMPLCIYFGLIK
ncbi:succinate dehydrogenase cytochrome b subunit [bacterium]|nr:MAG: succinate dehydrogenase cytochrome b subunit [bacterium]